ncbi:MAG: dockerin type I domain-containing protein [Planctomycetota bacterium]
MVYSLVFCQPAVSQPRFFISYSVFLQGMASDNNEKIDCRIGVIDSTPIPIPATMFVYVVDDQDIDTGAFLNVFSDNTSVAGFSGSTVFNPDITVSGFAVDVRWQSTSAGTSSGDRITDFGGLAITQGTGILTNQTSGNVFEDQLHDPTSDAFLFAQIDFMIVGDGVANFSLGVGNLGVVNNGFMLTPNFDGAELMVTAVLLGDVNMDGKINVLDVEPFIDVLASGKYLFEADINQDGFVNLLDVDPFIAVLSG